MKDYTQRPNVIKFFPWWVNHIDGVTVTKEDAIKKLEKGDKIKFVNHKDRLGLIQMIKENIK